MEEKSLLDRFWNYLYSRPWVLRLWGKHIARRWSEGNREKASIPFTPLGKPLSEARVALITTGGLHLPEQPPFDMENPEGDASFREIPREVDLNRLVITHKYYDHRDAERDKNILFPLDHLRDLQAASVVGALSPVHYSFMGHIEGKQTVRLLHSSAPAVAEALRVLQVDLALLTPA